GRSSVRSSATSRASSTPRPCRRTARASPRRTATRSAGPSTLSLRWPELPIPYPAAAVKGVRVDTLLSERGMFPSRSQAAASVLAGDVLVLPERRRVSKPGELVADDVELEV